MDYEFTTDWFSKHEKIWDAILGHFKPKTVLEVGSFEGRSTCHIIEKCANIGLQEIVCVDTWEGGEEHKGMDFDSIEKRFDSNIQKALKLHKDVHISVLKYVGLSHMSLASLITEQRKFDLIYIDGSHMAADVLADAVMSFKMLRVGGVLIFDDYALVDKSTDRFHHPQLAINAFQQVFENKLKKLTFKNQDGEDLDELLKKNDSALYQLYLIKMTE